MVAPDKSTSSQCAPPKLNDAPFLAGHSTIHFIEFISHYPYFVIIVTTSPSSAICSDFAKQNFCGPFYRKETNSGVKIYFSRYHSVIFLL